MAKNKINVDPMTRIEGHLKFETTVEDGIVTDARCSGEMFRGIEKALQGHDARVAQQVTQRVCGVCPYAHAEAASLALESAMGIRPNTNGQILRNLIVGAYQLQDYLLHFYVLCALDFIDISAVMDYQGQDSSLKALRDWVGSELSSNKIFPAAPFLPRYAAAYSKNKDLNISAIKHYLDAIAIMADLQKMVAIFGAKAPHPIAIEAGGVTTRPTVERIAHYSTLLDKAEPFIRNQYFNDLAGVAREFGEYFQEGKAYGHLLSFPYFPDPQGDNHAFAGGVTIDGHFQALDVNAIAEDHRYAYFKNEPSIDVKPLRGTDLEPIDWEQYRQEHERRDGKYSWSRAPRYRGEVMEVGPAARVVNTYRSGANPKLNALVDRLNGELGVSIQNYDSVMGRHLCRYITADIILDQLRENLARLEVGKPGFVEHDVPRNASGYGLTEASRGGLAHWIATDSQGLIRKYELIVPSTWNLSPRDENGKPGAVEKMLIGTRIQDENNPIEMTRIVRAADPCMACSVH
jgi:Ni,Fe-hydrogenase I large subunit